MALGDVVDEFHDEDGLSDAGTAKKTDLSALLVRSKKVNDLRKKYHPKVSMSTNDVNPKVPFSLMAERKEFERAKEKGWRTKQEKKRCSRGTFFRRNM